jgi:uncharacterized protein
MRLIAGLGLALAGVAAATGMRGESEGAQSVPKYPPQIVWNTEIRDLPQTRADRHYQLQIGLPWSFGKNRAQKYPVVFVTDGYYDFTGVLRIYQDLVYDHEVPEMLIVGLSYGGSNPNYERLRFDDLVPMLALGPDGAVNHSQADRFLEMIEKVAIPFVEREYGADPNHRYLLGTSAGGLFALYTLFTKPQLFQGYVAASPFVAPLWLYEENFAKSGQPIEARGFMSIGSYENPKYRRDAELFDERLSTRAYLKGGYQFREIEGMRHTGQTTESFVHGLKYVCEPIAPERGPVTGFLPDPKTRVYEIRFGPSVRLGPEAQWTPTERDVIARHRQGLVDLIKERKIFMAMRTPDGNSNTYSVLEMFATTQAQVEALAAADPAVSAGLMTFDISCLTESAQ